MTWKFWQKNTGGVKAPKLPKPKELPAGVGRYLVVDLKHDPDWVWTLKSVSLPKEGFKSAFLIRIYDDTTAMANGVLVKNYTSLDNHPGLVLFEGWYDKNTWAMEIKDYRADIIQTPAA